MTKAYIALGANVGDRVATLATALARLDALEDVRVAAVSRVYESEAWPDATDPAFANAVAVVETGLEADVLMRLASEIETDLGRQPGPRNAPRPIDLDIILFGDEEWDGPELLVPHPRFLEREFVVRPLLEVDPLVTMPDGGGVPVDQVSAGWITGDLGALPGFEGITRGPAADEPSGGWVEVAESGDSLSSGKFAGMEALLLFERSVLDTEGIPYAWDPYAPELWTSPWGLQRRFRLLVPATHAERARQVLREAIAAPPAPEEGPDEPGADQL